MPTFEIICLANSTKHGGRCIAGLKTDGSGWLRPVSIKSDGTLYPEHYMLDGDKEPKLFDILEIECIDHRPECHQPENWIISQKRWKFVGLSSRQQLKNILKPELDETSRLPELFGNLHDRVEYTQLQQTPTQRSLALIRPKIISWQVQEFPEKRKYRVSFILNNTTYHLGITDPNWQTQLAQLPVGSYSSEEVIKRLNLTDYRPDVFRLTVSLGEPFIPTGQNQRFCFKLVAAVINTTQITSYLSKLGVF